MFLEILQRYANFRYFRHAWLSKPKMIVSTGRKLQCSSVCQKLTTSFTSFLIYYILKDRATENRKFATYGFGGEIKITTLVFILDYFQEELMIKFFKKIPKTLFQSHFGSFFPYFGKNEFSWKNRLSVFKYSN